MGLLNYTKLTLCTMINTTYVVWPCLGRLSRVDTSGRVLFAGESWLNDWTEGSSRASRSRVGEVNVAHLHILAWCALATNKLHGKLAWGSPPNVLEAHIADLHQWRNLKTKRKFYGSIKRVFHLVCKQRNQSQKKCIWDYKYGSCPEKLLKNYRKARA